MVNKIFDLEKNYIPITDEIKSFFTNDVVFAYIPINGESLLEKLKEIRDNNSVVGYINVDSFFNQIENPSNLIDCVIKVEGELSNDTYFSSIYDADFERRIADISNFRDDFVDSVRNLKLSFIRKFLYNVENVDLYLSANGIEIGKSSYDDIINDYSKFKKFVLKDNCAKFISSCNSEVLIKCYKSFLKKLNKLIKDYSNDFIGNIRAYNNKRTTVKIVNPVVCDIYGTSSVKNYINKNYPKIRVKGMMKKDFISLIGGF